MISSARRAAHPGMAAPGEETKVPPEAKELDGEASAGGEAEAAAALDACPAGRPSQASIRDAAPVDVEGLLRDMAAADGPAGADEEGPPTGPKRRRSQLRVSSSLNAEGFKAARTGRRLSFADDHGHAVEKVIYSDQLHYSRSSSPREVPQGEACCAVS